MEEATATRKEDEHDIHFHIRTSAPFVELQKSISEEMKEVLKKTIAKMKEDGI